MAPRRRPAIVSALLLTLVCCWSCGREAPVGELRVVSTPAGAAVLIDGIATGATTPASLLLGVGSHRVAVSLAGHLVTPTVRDVPVTAGELATAEFALAALGSVTVTSDPAGAAILVDGSDSGYTTPSTFELVVGEHALELRLAGYADPAGGHLVDVLAAANPGLDVTLLPAGGLEVVSTPAGADIFLDGSPAGRLTPWLFNLPAGDHVVTVAREQFLVEPEQVVATVAVGDTVTAGFALTPVGDTGTLAVTSLPPGAAVWLDGEPTGEATPCSFTRPAASVEVTVALAGFRAPVPLVRTVTAGGSVAADFTLAARKVVLFETASGVNCEGCPAMNAMLNNLEVIGGYGHDRVVSIKYSEPIGGYDPHYAANPADNMGRLSFYQASTAWDWACPSLFFEGDLVVEPHGYPGYGEMVGLLDAALAEDPGFAVVVEVADFHAASLEVTVTVTAARAVSSTQPQLHLAIVENPVVYATPPGSYGETVFHWIMREFTTLPAAPLPLAAGESRTYQASIPFVPGWVAANLAAIAFVQDDTTLEILQAGAAFDPPAPRRTPAGRDHP